MSEVTVKGMADLQRFLDQLPAKMERNVMRGALRAGANVLKDEAKRNVPVDTGSLRNSIRVSVSARGGKVTASIRAGSRSAKKIVTQKKGGGISVKYLDAFYARFVEYGTAAHFVKSEKEKAWVERPNKRATKGVAKRLVIVNQIGKMHPGARAKPFMRTALDARAQDAVIASAEYIKNRLATKNGLDTSDVIIEGAA